MSEIVISHGKDVNLVQSSFNCRINKLVEEYCKICMEKRDICEGRDGEEGLEPLYAARYGIPPLSERYKNSFEEGENNVFCILHLPDDEEEKGKETALLERFLSWLAVIAPALVDMVKEEFRAGNPRVDILVKQGGTCYYAGVDPNNCGVLSNLKKGR